MRQHLAALAAALVVTLAAGCASSLGRQTTNTINDAGVQADEALAALRTGAPARDRSGVRIIEDRMFVAGDAINLNVAPSLPACPITFAPAASVTLLEFGQIVSRECGVQVRVTPDALQATSPAGYQGADSEPAGPSVDEIPLPPGVNLPAPVGGGASSRYERSLSPHRISMRFEGELDQLLDAVTARLGLSWRYEKGIVTVFYIDTRFFQIAAIPTATDFESIVTSGASSTAGVSGGTTGSSQGGGSEGGMSGEASSSQSTNVTLRTNPTADLIAAINSMLTPGVGRMSHSPSTGTLSVTDRDEVLDRVETYVDRLNDLLTKQVLLNVRVLSVTLDNNNEWGINWNAIYNNLSDTYGLGLVGGHSPSAAAVSGSLNILEGSSRFSGSQLIFDALAQQGRVSTITQPSVTAMNFEPYPIQISDTDGYVAQTITTLTGGDGNFAQTSRITGSVTTGFNMTLLPHIQPDNETVLLQFSMQTGALKRMRSVGDEDNLVEIPDTSNRNFTQKARLRSGETLVLSGFDQEANTNERTGVGRPGFWLFGGGSRTAKTREVLVVLITPIVLD